MQKKILVIRFSSIGDIVLTSPVVRCLHEQLDAEVHVITKDVFADLYRNNPHVHNVITIQSKVDEVADILREEKFDFIADLHNNLRSFQVKRICKTASASFPKLNVRKWMQVNLHADVMPHIHIVDRYFQAVEDLGVKNDGKGLDYFIAEGNVVDITRLPPAHQRGYIALTAGAKFATKEMPVEKIIEVIQRLQQPVVVLGGKAEVPKGETIAKACGDLVVNACGQYNLDQSASLIQQAKLVITHDTGMMHIAAAFKKKIYSVWGNTVPEFGMYPYQPAEGSRVIEVKNLYCRPCSKIGYSKCPEGHFRCMNDIAVSAFES